MASAPELSIVVTPVEGEPALGRCLEAVLRQEGAPPFEVIVPFDHTIAEAGALAHRFRNVTFLLITLPSGLASPANAFEKHQLYEYRRAAGLRAARAPLVGLVEDRGAPSPAWARTMVALHRRSKCGAIGGAVESGAGDVLRSALYFCDYARYQPPLPETESEYLTDINICYRRDALEDVRGVWEESYQEANVNWALRARGWRLLLSGEPRVVQRRSRIGLAAAIVERFHWARGFSHVRARTTSPAGCVLWAAAAPLLPFVLLARQIRLQMQKRSRLAEFALALPAVALMLLSWSAGEFAGYCEAALSASSSAGSGTPRRQST